MPVPPAAPPRPSSGRPILESVQLLRAVAAGLVLVEHVIRETQSRFGLSLDFGTFPWPMGVDIFFVVSGFIMYHTNRQYFGRAGEFPGFLVRRFTRIAPPYYLFTTLIIGATLILPQLMGKTRFDLGQAISSYLFVPYKRYDGRISPILSLGWTLNFEMFFYIIFGLHFALPARRLVPVLSATLLAIAAAGIAFSPETTVLRFWSTPIILEFLFGVWVAAAADLPVSERTRHRLGTGVALCALPLAWLLTRQLETAGFERVFSMGIPAALLVWAFSRLISSSTFAKTPRLFSLLGDSSYSLYLSHRFPLRLTTVLWGRLVQYQPVLVYFFAPAVIVICVAVAIFVYLKVEVPLIRLCRVRGASRSAKLQGSPLTS